MYGGTAMKRIRLGYFADGPWAHRTFDRLIEDKTIELAFICVRFDKKDSELIKRGEKYGIDILISSNINREDFRIKMTNYNVDLFVSMSFNQIFKKEMINLPPLGTINCHAGKLPFYRGRNVLNWVLINDEKEFGITVHYMDEGIDTGDIILQRCFEITDEDNYSTLLSVAYSECSKILYDAIKSIQNGTVKRKKQDFIDPVGTYCGIRIEGDEILDWNQSSRDIFNFVRALCKPGPQATSYVGNNMVYINKVNLIQGAHKYKGVPGQVIGMIANRPLVKTNDTMVEIEEYTSYKKLKIGDRLKREIETLE